MLTLSPLLEGRLLDQEGLDQTCWLHGVNEYRCLVECEVPRCSGDKSILYFEKLGRIEGVFGLGDDRIFAFSIKASQRQRADLRSRIGWINRHQRGELHDRRIDERMPGNGREVVIAQPERGRGAGVLVDISRTGAQVRTEIRPSVGERVFLGRRAATVVRQTTDGIAVSFVLPLPEHLLAQPDL